MLALPDIQYGLAVMKVKVLFTPTATLECILKQELGAFQATPNSQNFCFVEQIWVYSSGMKT